MLATPFDFPLPDDMVFFSWRYDDGSEVGLLINGDDEVEKEISFANSEERKQVQRQLKMRTEKKQREFEKRPLTIPCGLNYIRPKDLEDCDSSVECQRWKNDGKEAVLALLYSAGQDCDARKSVMQLFSSCLGGYLYRFLLKKDLFPTEEKTDIHAPILVCSVAEGAGDLLKRIVNCLSIRTEKQVKRKKTECGTMHQHQPACLPDTLTRTSLSNCAYIQLVRDVDFDGKIRYYHVKLPAQYRDTCVFLNARFFNQRELLRFQQRSPFATMLFYGLKETNTVAEPIRIDGKKLTQWQYTEGWDEEAVNVLTQYFLAWLMRQWDEDDTEQKYRDKIDDICARILEHNKKRGTKKIRGLARIWLITQMLAVMEFLSFGVQFGCWDSKQQDALWPQWMNLLLPGSFSSPEHTVPLGTPERIVIPEFDCEEIFRVCIIQMLKPEHWEHYVAVPARESFPRRAKDMIIWGYVRMYRDNKKHRSILTLMMQESSFCSLATDFAPVACDYYEIVKALRKKAPAYLHSSKTVRMPGISESAVQALIIDVDAADFLPDEARSFLFTLLLSMAPELEESH